MTECWRVGTSGAALAVVHSAARLWLPKAIVDATLLDHLVTSGPLAVTVVTTLRDDVGANAALDWVDQCAAVERILVEPLEEAALRQIVRREARLAGVEPSDDEVRAAAADCRGRPIFAELAGRDMGRTSKRGDGSLGTSLRSLLEESGPLAREVLAVVVAVDAWTDESLLAEALARPPGEVADELTELDRAALIRRAGAEGPGGRVDVYHDAVRTVLAAMFAGQELVAAHARLVKVLQGRDAPPERLVRHLLGAGPVPLARRYLAAAGQRLAGRVPNAAMVRIMPVFLRGVEFLRGGENASADRELAAAERRLVEAGLMGTYEYMRLLYHQTMVAYFRSDVTGLEAHLIRWRAASADAENLATRSNRATLELMYDVHRGRFDEARQNLGSVAAAYPKSHLNLQRDAISFLMSYPDVFDRDCREARRRIAELTAMRHSFRGLSDMYASVYAGIGAMVEANALRSGDPSASRFTVHLYSALARAAPPLRGALAIRAEAYAAGAAGEPEVAVSRLREAERHAQQYRQPVELAVAQYQLGLRLGGTRGQALKKCAEKAIGEVRGSPRLLHEDVGYR